MLQKIILKLKEDLLLYIFLALGFLLRLFYIFSFTKPESYLWSDAAGYDGRAMEMAKGAHVMFSTYFPPFFHIFLSIIYRPLIWLGIESWRIKIDVIIFALFYIIAFWCVYQIVKKLFSNKVALIVLLVLILWYPFIYLNALIMSENLFFLLFFLGLYLLITKTDKTSMGFWVGLSWGLAVITRPIFALALPLFVFWGLYYKINWKFLLSFIITAGLIIASMMAFNFWYTNGAEKSISSNGGVNFAMTWCDAKSVQFSDGNYYYWFAPPSNSDYPDSKRVFTSVPFNNQKYYYQMGIDCIKENPGRIINNFSSIKNLFHSQLFPTTDAMAGWQNFRLIFKILTGIFFALGLLTIIGLLRKNLEIEDTNKKYFYLLSFIVFSLLLTVCLQNPGEERYLIPYAPILIILSLPIILAI